MKKILLSLSVITSVILFTGCSKSSSPSNNASVMFVNGSVGTANVNVSANNSAVSAAQNLAFFNNSGYQNITAGSAVNISYILTASGLTLGTSSVALTASNSYSIFLGGSVTIPKILVTQDVLTAPASGNAEVRIVNLSPDTLSLTAYAGATSFASGIGSISASAFTSIAAGSYTLKAGDPSNISTVVPVSHSVSLASGGIYTLIYTGTSTGSGTSAYTLTVINNN